MDEEMIPVKLNALKHHFRFLCAMAENWKGSEWETVRVALQELGSNQFDVYLGKLSPGEICHEIDRSLTQTGIHSREDLRAWLGRSGYKTMLISDGSSWVIRESEPGGQFVHIHPARQQPVVKRFRATHLKTAVAVIFECREPDRAVPGLSTSRINELRRERLGLSPVKSLGESRKIAETIHFFCTFTLRELKT